MTQKLQVVPLKKGRFEFADEFEGVDVECSRLVASEDFTLKNGYSYYLKGMPDVVVHGETLHDCCCITPKRGSNSGSTTVLHMGQMLNELARLPHDGGRLTMRYIVCTTYVDAKSDHIIVVFGAYVQNKERRDDCTNVTYFSMKAVNIQKDIDRGNIWLESERDSLLENDAIVPLFDVATKISDVVTLNSAQMRAKAIAPQLSSSKQKNERTHVSRTGGARQSTRQRIHAAQKLSLAGRKRAATKAKGQPKKDTSK